MGPRSVVSSILFVFLALSIGCSGGSMEAPFAPSSSGPSDLAAACAPADETPEAGGEPVPDGCGLDAAAARKAAPRMQKTRYLAFGDSVTEGFVREKKRISRSSAYPGQLQKMLGKKYSAQKVSVVNAGLGGETAAQGRGRLPGVLSQHAPEVLLLIEGYNNIRHVDASSIESDLRAMVQEAQGRGISVLLGTLTPIAPAKERHFPGTRAAVEAANTRIRSLAPELDVPLLDLYAILDGRWGLFGSDGLHPTSSGYRVIAETFFNEIVNRFTVVPGLSPDRLTEVEPGLVEPAAPPDRGWLAPHPAGGSAFDAGTRRSSPFLHSRGASATVNGHN